MPTALLRWLFLLVPPWPCSTTRCRAEAYTRRVRLSDSALEPRCSASLLTAILALKARCAAQERAGSSSREQARTTTLWHRSWRRLDQARTSVIDPAPTESAAWH